MLLKIQTTSNENLPKVTEINKLSVPVKLTVPLSEIYLHIGNQVTSQKQYSFDLAFSGKPKKTHTNGKKRLTNRQK